MYIPEYYVAIPVKLTEAQEGFRDQFDPKYEVNEAHATLIAPFAAKYWTPELDQHFSEVSSEFRKQEITAKDYYITNSGYIFYVFDEPSNALLTAMNKRLHEHTMLEGHQSDHLWKFLPHITLGKFEAKHKVPEFVQSILYDVCQLHVIQIDRFRLYGILNERTKRVHVKDYLLFD